MSASYSRREIARLALAGTTGFLLMTKPTQADPTVLNVPAEADSLIESVPRIVGYTLTETQAKEVVAALKEYPKSFAKAREFTLPNAVEPAFAPYPPQTTRKGRTR